MPSHIENLVFWWQKGFFLHFQPFILYPKIFEIPTLLISQKLITTPFLLFLIYLHVSTLTPHTPKFNLISLLSSVPLLLILCLSHNHTSCILFLLNSSTKLLQLWNLDTSYQLLVLYCACYGLDIDPRTYSYDTHVKCSILKFFFFDMILTWFQHNVNNHKFKNFLNNP